MLAVLLFRLRMCWLCLFSGKAVLYCPRYHGPKEGALRVLAANLITPEDWLSLVGEGCAQYNKTTARDMEKAQDALLAEARSLTNTK